MPEMISNINRIYIVEFVMNQPYNRSSTYASTSGEALKNNSPQGSAALF